MGARIAILARMSAVQSLLRVMALRDAEAIVLEAGRVPTLRRRGQAEPLAMPALEATLLAEFAAPLLGDKRVEDGQVSSTFVDTDGAAYACTIDRASAGLRIVARRKPAAAAPAAPPPAPAAPAATAAPTAWWAKAAAPAVAAPPTIVSAPTEDRTGASALAHLAQLLTPLVAIARERRASDILVSTGKPPHLRVDGRLETLESVEHDDAELAACVVGLGNNSDHSLEVAGTRLRVNAFDHLSGRGIAARIVNDRVPALSELGLPPELAGAIEHREGLVLVCGSTGSGKSTTLAALIDLIDQRRAAHIITLEDPIEYRFTPRRSLVHQREVGIHVESFATGLRAALREAPDVILLGELRDIQTIAAALTAAETGHLVLATLHAPNAAGAIDRMIDAFPEGQQRQVRWQLASVLRTVITQYLLPRKDGGRIAAVEHVPVNAAVANIMRKGDLHMLPSTIQSGGAAGMIPLERSLARLLDQGLVTRDAVKRIAADQDLLAALAGKLR